MYKFVVKHACLPYTSTQPIDSDIILFTINSMNDKNIDQTVIRELYTTTILPELVSHMLYSIDSKSETLATIRFIRTLCSHAAIGFTGSCDHTLVATLFDRLLNVLSYKHFHGRFPPTTDAYDVKIESIITSFIKVLDIMYTHKYDFRVGIEDTIERISAVVRACASLAGHYGTRTYYATYPVELLLFFVQRYNIDISNVVFECPANLYIRDPVSLFECNEYLKSIKVKQLAATNHIKSLYKGVNFMAETRKSELTDMLIESYCDIDGRRLLHHCAILGLTSGISYAVHRLKNVDLYAIDYTGKSILDLAREYKQHAFVTSLLQYHAAYKIRRYILPKYRGFRYRKRRQTMATRIQSNWRRHKVSGPLKAHWARWRRLRRKYMPCKLVYYA